MPETLKPDELVLTERLREIYHSGDHERGCQGREYSCTCGYDARNEETAFFAEHRILDLQSDLERVTAERDAALAKWERADGMDGAVVHAIREVLYAGQVPLSAFIDSHVAIAIAQRDEERTRALTAEAALVKARKALEPFAKAADDAEKHAGWDGPRGDFISYEVLRAARLALSAGEEENGR